MYVIINEFNIIIQFMCPIRMVKLYEAMNYNTVILKKIDYSHCVMEQSKVTPTDRTHA